MASSSTYEIAPDISDEEEEEDLVATSSRGLLPTHTVPSSSSKGKGRAISPSNNFEDRSTVGRAGAGLEGRIGSGPNGQQLGERTQRSTTFGGIKTETRYTGSDTLDEPVTETIMRDLRAIGNKVVQVLYPQSDNAVLRDWDLWGPLLFCLTLAILLSTNAPAEQSLQIFTGVFVIVWLGSVVVTLNAKLLGGKVSFFQSLCVLGYCIFPLDLAAFVSIFVKMLWIRLPICFATFAWSVWAAVNFLAGTRLEKDRAVLAVFPLFMLFFLLAWMTMLS
ncbi:Yip4p [Sporobolomyces salmoneus]|uniref:Yip4p n=1 Tax=Sporobolomyces salmoneus TaxID=183962 RepID=UPI003171E181